MMVSNCPLAFRHKKGEYTCRGFLLLEGDVCGAIRLYLGASLCTYFLALDVFCLVIHGRGRYIILYMLLVSLLIDLYL